MALFVEFTQAIQWSVHRGAAGSESTIALTFDVSMRLLKERIASTVLILLFVLSPSIPPSPRLEGSSLRRYCCSYRAQRSFLLRCPLGIRKHSCSCRPRLPTLERSRSYLLPPRLNLRHSHCRRLPLGHLWTRYLRRGQAQQAIRGR